MANSLIGNSAVATHMYQALYGQAPSNGLYNSYIDSLAATSPAAFAATLAGNFANFSDADLALRVLDNLGVTATTVTATGEYAKLKAALTDAFAAFPNMRGQVILNATNLFGNLEADATYGAAATTYNKQALANFTYASNTANTTPGTAAIPDPTVGQTYTLTTGVDTFTGGAGNDTFNATNTTLTALDTINGGGGTNNILNINDLLGGAFLPASATLSNIQTINLASAGAATLDVSGASVTGVTALNVTQGTSAVAVAGKAAAITVSGVTGSVTADGGSTQTVTSKGAVTLGATTGASGAITITNTAQGANNIAIDGGTTVTATVTEATTGANTITIGAVTKPTGAVTITDTQGPAASGVFAGGLITVNGGTTVSVTETGTQPKLATAGANSTTTQSAVTVNGSTGTTAVTVSQSAAVASKATVVAAAGAAEVDTVKFVALTAGQTAIIDGVTLVAPAAGYTAKQAAAAFAGLTLTNWTTSAVSGTGSDTVTFTAAATGVGAVADTGSLTTTITPVTTGVASATAAGVGGVGLGAVTVVDAKATIASVTLANYGNSTINSDAMTALTLSGDSGTLGITHAAQTALGLTVNGLVSTISKDNTITDSSNGYKTLAFHTTGAASKVSGIADTAATTLTVDGTQVLTLTSAAGLTTLKTVTVSGSAGLTVTAGLAASVTDVNASATSGAVTLSIDPTTTTYEGGSGVDTVTVNKAPMVAISGGAGTDVLVLNVSAVTFSNPSANTFLSGFETLGLGAGATGTYDATGFAHLTEGAITAGPVGYSNVAAGVDLTLSASPTVATTYALKDATGSADALTVTLGKGVAGGSLTANGIETVTVATNSSLTSTASLTLVDDSVTAIKVTGGASNLTLTTTGDTTLTSVDASAMTGGLTYKTAGTVAEVVKGGASANTLTSLLGTTVADTLIGGAGADTITANKGLDTLTGNGGNDTFVIVATANVNSYATITDINSGDTISLVNLGTETFQQSKIALASTAVFQDYANAAVNAGGDASASGYIAWFQYGGDTYVVESLHNATTTLNFSNGTDAIVKLTGVVDLSTATLFNASATPLIVLH